MSNSVGLRHISLIDVARKLACCRPQALTRLLLFRIKGLRITVV
jgi:hypothetical protein